MLARALNYHFNCDDPSGWHFQLQQRSAKMRTAQQLCPGVLHTRRRTLVTLKKKLPWWHGKLLTRSAFSFAKFLKRARPDTADTARLLDSRKRNCTRRRAADGTQDRREYEAAFLDEAVWTAANATVGPIGDSCRKQRGDEALHNNGRLSHRQKKKKEKRSLVGRPFASLTLLPICGLFRPLGTTIVREVWRR